MLKELTLYRSLRNKSQNVNSASYTEAEADKAMVELLSHTFEELMELRMCVNRKSWKPMPSLRGTDAASLQLREQALEELADVLLMLDAFRDAAAFTYNEVEQAVLSKCDKNLVRADHVCNKPTDN